MDYPHWICRKCGAALGRRDNAGECATFHEGECDVCGKTTFVTQPRDFGHLAAGWRLKALTLLGQTEGEQ